MNFGIAIDRVGAPPFVCDLDAQLDGEPASIFADGNRVHVLHHRFCAAIDPHRAHATLFQPHSTDRAAEEIVLRTALGCVLPLRGGMLLHSAGAVIDGGACLFFGVSGAGKSTLSELLTVPILSDELVVIERHDDAFVASASGFWGTYDRVTAPGGSFPLRAVVALERGDDLALDRINARDALRRLINVAVVPPLPELWDATLRVLTAIAVTLPAYRMAWTPSRDRAAELVHRLSV